MRPRRSGSPPPRRSPARPERARRMRVLMLTQTAPHLPTHDRARLVPAYLLAHLAERHQIALIAPEMPGDTPAQRAWAASVAAAPPHVPGKRWGQTLTRAPPARRAPRRPA